MLFSLLVYIYIAQLIIEHHREWLASLADYPARLRARVTTLADQSIELFRGHVTLQLNARAIEAGVQVSPSSYGTLCCFWLFQALWTR